MSDHLQHQLRDLGDQISKIVANHSRIRGPAAKDEPDDLAGNTADDAALAERNADTIDRDIADVEKMLQQWLVTHGKDA